MHILPGGDWNMNFIFHILGILSSKLTDTVRGVESSNQYICFKMQYNVRKAGAINRPLF